MSGSTQAGWTLLHFVWQGAALAAAYGLARFALRNASPQPRYVAGCVTLASMAIAPAVTWLALEDRSAAQMTFVDGSTFLISAAPERGWQSALEPMLPWLVMAWMAGAALLLARSLGGWLLARRIANSAGGVLPECWAARTAALRERMGIAKDVVIRISHHVEVPQVFGWLKPVVLVPASALMGLTAEQLESILAHEFAHVRRHDYLVNLVQTAVESLLFYHPAVWWVSREVREDRERCCDDLAVEVCGDRLEYSRALLRLEEARTVMALAATGGDLKGRVARLLGSQESKAPVPVAAALILLIAAGGWLVNAQEKKTPPPTPPAPPAPASAPSPVIAPAPAPKPPVPPRPAKTPRPTIAGEPDSDIDIHEIEETARRAAEEGMRQAQETLQEQLVHMQAELKRALSDQKLTEQARQQIERSMQDAKREMARAKQDLQRAMLEAKQASTEQDRRRQYANEKWQDGDTAGSNTPRGRIYRRYGPPDEIETHAGVKEVWLYRNQQGAEEMRFTFDLKPKQ